MMTVKEMLGRLLSENLICDQYRSRVEQAKSKAVLAEIVCDTNGADFLCAQIASGMELDYAQAAEYFSNHFNGARVFEYTTPDGSYTSETYCGYSGEIAAKTTIITLLGCDVSVSVPSGALTLLHVDPNTRCFVDCAEGARAICIYWGEIPEYSGDVRFIKGQE